MGGLYPKSGRGIRADEVQDGGHARRHVSVTRQDADSRAALAAGAGPAVPDPTASPGEDCFLLKVHAPAVDALEAVLDQFLLYGQTISFFVVSTPVEPARRPYRSGVRAVGLVRRR